MATKSAPKAAAAAAFTPQSIRVQATRDGYYDLQYRRAGDKFVFVRDRADKEIPSWCKPLDAKVLAQVPQTPIPQTEANAEYFAPPADADADDESTGDLADGDDNVL